MLHVRTVPLFDFKNLSGGALIPPSAFIWNFRVVGCPVAPGELIIAWATQSPIWMVHWATNFFLSSKNPTNTTNIPDHPPGLGSNTFYQIQIQIQIFQFHFFKYKYKYKYEQEKSFKYKYKFKYIESNTNTNTRFGNMKILNMIND